MEAMAHRKFYGLPNLEMVIFHGYVKQSEGIFFILKSDEGSTTWTSAIPQVPRPRPFAMAPGWRKQTSTAWWFQTFFSFHNIWDNFSHTNQVIFVQFYEGWTEDCTIVWNLAIPGGIRALWYCHLHHPRVITVKELVASSSKGFCLKLAQQSYVQWVLINKHKNPLTLQ